MSLQTLKNQKGFTIVELLIVIVVIGILAAITIVAYNGIQNRAKTTKSQSAASDVQKKAEAYNAINEHYPLTPADFAGDSALSTGNAVSLTEPTDAARATTAHYVPCPASATASTITGAHIHYYDFSGGAFTTAASGGKSLTVGTC